MHYLTHTWRGMMDRCYNQNSPSFKHYGGRGIKVCERWHDANQFLQDVGYPPDMDDLVGQDLKILRSRFSIDRVDVNGDYEPGNVRWADAVTQANNRQIPNAGTIEVRNGKYRVRIRMRGVSLSATFDTREEAEAWRKESVAKVERDMPPPPRPERSVSCAGTVENRGASHRASLRLSKTFDTEAEAHQWLEAQTARLGYGDAR